MTSPLDSQSICCQLLPAGVPYRGDTDVISYLESHICNSSPASSSLADKDLIVLVQMCQYSVQKILDSVKCQDAMFKYQVSRCQYIVSSVQFPVHLFNAAFAHIFFLSETVCKHKRKICINLPVKYYK